MLLAWDWFSSSHNHSVMSCPWLCRMNIQALRGLEIGIWKVLKTRGWLRSSLCQIGAAAWEPCRSAQANLADLEEHPKGAEGLSAHKYIAFSSQEKADPGSHSTQQGFSGTRKQTLAYGTKISRSQRNDIKSTLQIRSHFWPSLNRGERYICSSMWKYTRQVRDPKGERDMG